MFTFLSFLGLTKELFVLHRGEACQEDVSFNFNGSSIPINLTSSGTELDVTLSYVASLQAYEDLSVLLQLTDEAQNQLEIQLQDNGMSIVISNEEKEINATFMNADLTSLHQVRVKTFDNGRQIMLKIDQSPAKYFVLINTTFNNDWISAEIGNPDFTGCMSALKINHMTPLKTESGAFSGACRAIKSTRDADEELAESTTLTTEFFDDFSTITALDNDTLISDESENDFDEIDTFTLIKWISVVVLLIVLTIAYFVKKYLRRHTGVYITREDAGEVNAPDADTAVLHSKTGHLVEKKQEWFF